MIRPDAKPSARVADRVRRAKRNKWLEMERQALEEAEAWDEMDALRRARSAQHRPPFWRMPLRYYALAFGIAAILWAIITSKVCATVACP